MTHILLSPALQRLPLDPNPAPGPLTSGPRTPANLLYSQNFSCLQYADNSPICTSLELLTHSVAKLTSPLGQPASTSSPAARISSSSPKSSSNTSTTSYPSEKITATWESSILLHHSPHLPRIPSAKKCNTLALLAKCLGLSQLCPIHTPTTKHPPAVPPGTPPISAPSML